MDRETEREGQVWDVAIIGGALAGSAVATLLLRSDPTLRVLVLEKSTAFGRRVGEATVEVSAFFLGRVLGLTHHLNHHHLIKQGMRFWFFNEKARDLPDCSEIGGHYLARLPSYQVDRAVLDEEVLRTASCAGAHVWRPASVRQVSLSPGGTQLLKVSLDGTEHDVRARWVVDASGVAALLARQQGWWQQNTAHPTAAAWARWTGVKDLDGLALAQKFPAWANACKGIRATATNHLLGPGWWAWCIPLKGGDVSIGVVFDQRLVDWPQTGTLGQRLKDFLCQHPLGHELLADATWVEGDVHWRKNLAYSSRQFAGDDFLLVGDAAAFIDPFYSPGMDWLSFTSSSAASLILAHRTGAPAGALAEKYNRDFTRSYSRWFDAVYRDKYFYIAEYDLMRLAFLLDVGLYYFGVASQPFKLGPRAYSFPMFSTPPSTPFYHFMRTYNRRLACIAAARQARHAAGARNSGYRFLFGGFTFSMLSATPLLRAILSWLILELREGWRSWFKMPQPWPLQPNVPIASASPDSLPKEAPNLVGTA